jgi:hypothetical protein
VFICGNLWPSSLHLRRETDRRDAAREAARAQDYALARDSSIVTHRT